MNSDLERCMEKASRFLPEFSDGWYTAMARYRRTDPELLSEHDDAVAAMNVRAHMWMEVRRRFTGRPGFVLRELRGLKYLLFRDEFSWRFKKVDRLGRHTNYPTQQQKDYDYQLPLPGLPEPAIRLTSGYQLDASGQAIERVIVARPYGRSIQWAAQVNVVGAAAEWVEITPRRFAGTEQFQRKKGGGATR